ncbi:ABC-type multidrug transport system, ATPase component [Clostridium amylolyticum]|uniref:ABC-type multidrug transport system, ATPase component n=1 Tax=Clostridium amylolyticum TaxID=1121298 RepID=A0A1M6JN17_9CLOT|nr:ABC transporter ATP-binding protein [Clostridium amylolyticum]SHJ48105.1 ABC-type multidrug transport system, ATPase component [Clostridium amylolyticum]
MLKVENLTKKYNKVDAVKNVNFTVEPGNIAVLAGPNGAGKSTTIKCITGLLRYEGKIEVCNKENKTPDGKRCLGYVPEVPALYDYLTVYEHIQFIAKAYGVTEYEEKAEELLKRFELYDKKDKLGRELSKGMQQKISICCAAIINPKVILFDEPMVGLDPKAIKELKLLITELKMQNTAIVISTHLLDSVEDIWDKILIMKNGEIILSRTREELHLTGESLEELFFEVTEG